MSASPEILAQLTPATRLLVEAIAKAPYPPMYTLSAEQAKAGYAKSADVLDVPKPDLPRVEELQVPTRDGAHIAARLYADATDKIQQEVSTGTSLTAAMSNANVFPSMVIQMCAIGEESGSIDHMLGKAADFYEAEVDEMVAGLSSLMEPIIIVFLGTLIGGIVVSMYLPIFKLGQVV